MTSSMAQCDIFERIINRKTYATIVGTDVQNAVEKYLTNASNYWNDKLQGDIDDYNKTGNTDQQREAASLQFNKDQTQMQATLTMTNSTAQKATSFVSTLQSDQQSTLTSTSYLTMMGQYLNGLLKTAL
jgi:hypothetical protein